MNKHANQQIQKYKSNVTNMVKVITSFATYGFFTTHTILRVTSNCQETPAHERQ